MVAQNETLFRLISVGFAAANKERGKLEVEVFLKEITPIADGEVKDEVTETTSEGEGADGRPYSIIVHLSNTVEATWKGSGGNRVTAPDVRRGDELEIWQYSDVDKYYWSLRATPEHTARKLETVVNAYNASPDEEDNTPSEENSYTTQVSTHDGHMTIKTTKANGEPFAYTIQLNTKDGNAAITDNAGLYIQADSAAKRITMDNGGGSVFDMDNGKTTLNCDEFNVNASNNINFKMGTFKVSGKYEQKGDTIMKGKVAIRGSSLTHNGVNVGNTHFHIGNQGKPVSSPQ